MGGFIERVQEWWAESTATQRYTTLGGIALFIIMIGGVFSFASRPKYDLLYSGLSETDKAAIVTDLQGMGISAKYDMPGAVEVPSDRVAELRMKLTASGKVPKSAHMGYENLADMSLSDTPLKERERLKAIQEGELAKSIETNPGVRSARVHLTLGDPSPFGDQQRPPSASVNLVTNGSGALTREQAKGIAMLVSHSIDGLDMKNVVVLDEKSVALYNGTDLSGSDAIASSKIELEQSLARKEEQRMQSNLDAIFGPGSTKASVRCVVNLDEKEVKKIENTFRKGTPLKTMEEKMAGGKVGASGPGGITAQGGAPSAPDSNKAGDYSSKVEQLQPSTETTETHTNKAVGTIQTMVINVAANTAKFPDAEKADEFVSQVETFMMAEQKRGDTTMQIRVNGVKFDETVKVAIDKSVEEAKGAATKQQIISLLPIGALLLIGIMVVKQVSKMKPTTTSIVTADGQTLTVPLVNGQIPANYAMVGGGSTQTPGLVPAASTGLMNELNHNHSKYTEEELAAMGEDGIIYRDNGDVVEVEKIKERKSVHLAAIKQMAKDRPEPTAMLIKAWLTEA